MKLLALDTSSLYASCAVLADGEIVAEKTLCNGLLHSRSLLPLVEDCLSGASLTVSDLDCLACVAGPGSFTGVRIGVCALKGLAQPHRIPCVALNTMDVLQRNLPFASCVCPILDARRGQVYTAVYESGSCTLPCDARPLEALADLVRGKHPVFTGDGVRTCRKKLIELLGDEAAFAPASLAYTRAGAAAELAAEAFENGNAVPCEALDAIYLRKPQAEREYADKHPNT